MKATKWGLRSDSLGGSVDGLSGRTRPPDGVRQIVCDDECAARIARDPDRATKCLSVSLETSHKVKIAADHASILQRIAKQ